MLLARRLDITLLSTVDDPTKLALALAADIGAANAAIESQLIALLRTVGEQTKVDEILRVAAAELRLHLELRFGDISVAAVGERETDSLTMVGPFTISDSATGAVTLWAAAGKNEDFVTTALTLIVPLIRAAWFESGALEMVDGLSAVAAIDEAAMPDNAALQTVMPRLGWRDGEAHAVVFLAPPESRRTRTLSNVVRLLWRRAAMSGSLVDTADGWISVVPLGEDDDTARVSRELGGALATSLGELGIGIGLSRAHDSPGNLQEQVVEARIASRTAWAAGVGSVGSFEELTLQAIDYLFDPNDAITVARLVVPEFCNASDRDRLVTSVRAFLDEGSVVAAAARLSLHRNTMTARLDRARALGLPVGDPHQSFSVEAIIRAFLPRDHVGGDTASPTRKTSKGLS
ncbi:PucR-like helix-turn-helix protein [Microcella alkaliphila]|uniref:PucR-like helix-turn-helix protein n=2 Tax=Microcella alkaliphila TaxID=279828 RepID=A0A4Q7TJW5_9MICO|nr:PucR-like helix-turn-helix protein [Microcella alkaliphila]